MKSFVIVCKAKDLLKEINKIVNGGDKDGKTNSKSNG